MAGVTFRAAIVAGAFLVASSGVASAEPVPGRCLASFVLSDVQGARASGDLKDGALERLYVEMGPTRAPLTTKGDGVSGAYTARTPELTYWHYMSIYERAKEWLAPGSVRLDYSGFRIGWPEMRSRGKVVKQLKLTVAQGDQSMTIDVGPDAKGNAVTSHVIAIDFVEMLVGPYPGVRVPDHQAWRNVEAQRLPLTVTLADASNGKVMARGQIAGLSGDTQQTLLSGGVNALREAFKAGRCG